MSTVLITGATGGIGKAILKNFSQDKHFDVLGLSSKDCDLNSLHKIEENIKNYRVADISTLILAAGINEPKPLLETNLELINKTINTNVLGHKIILDLVLPHMVQNKFGRIVALSSLYSQKSRNGRWAYSASKAMLETLIRSVALEFAEYNILANSVVPGFVDTPLTRKNNLPSAISSLTSKIPIGRMATAQEIADLVYFLASSSNRYITGQSFFVDGGISLL